MDFASLAGARVVDLSLTLSERLPGTWPGHMTYAHHNWNWFAEVDGPTGKTRSAAPYQTNFVIIDEHCGTHFDAPTHFIPPGQPGFEEAGGEEGPGFDFLAKPPRFEELATRFRVTNHTARVSLPSLDETDQAIVDVLSDGGQMKLAISEYDLDADVRGAGRGGRRRRSAHT
jgi:hypothetical protein